MQNNVSNNIIDRTFIEKTDLVLIKREFPLHSRPLHVVMAWMQFKGLSGDILASELWGPLMIIYNQLYPSSNFSMPSMLVGGVGLRDQMYLARVNVCFGSGVVDPIKCIDITPLELEIIWKQDPSQVWRAIYSVADLWDFAYSVNDLRSQNHDADQLWSNAGSALSGTARTLAGDHDLATTVQSACLSAELAMKGVLAFFGWSEPRRRKLNHHLADLAEAVISCSSTVKDEDLMRACAEFPDYVRTRYDPHGLSRIQLMTLGMRSQFVAAEVLRRVSERNFAGEIEADHLSPPRENI
jgi:hypothetical protein